MSRLVLPLIVSFFVAVPARGQSGTVSGVVVDQLGSPVAGAVVVLSGPGGQLTTVSASKGDYVFNDLPSGTYTVRVTAAGFAPVGPREVAVDIGRVDLPPIVVTIAPLSETIVVSASKTEDTLGTAPATMSVVPSALIATTSAQNFADLLRSVPGINAIQLSARDVNLTSRQATSALANTQLVLLDGRSIYLDFFGFVMWDFVPINWSDIKQIEVVRGPASVVWGANAFNGVVNVITKSPRESEGTSVTLGSGLFSRDAGSTKGRGVGAIGNAGVSVSRAPNARWAYRVSAGYFHSDALPRPSGQIPLIVDPRDPRATVGGGIYPADGSGPSHTAFTNSGTNQPKFDARVDQEISNGQISYSGGLAGTSGISHSAIGPFAIQPGSVMGYGSIRYRKGTFKLNAFSNIVSASGPDLLLIDPATGKDLQLDLTSRTYDVEAGDLRRVGSHVFTFGGNARRNRFDISTAPAAKQRTELGAYLQDEIVWKRAKLATGGRVDKFGNLDSPVFSPRVALTYLPVPSHALRLSYNRAFLSPSVIDNFLDIQLVIPVDLSGIAPLLPPALQPLVQDPFPLVVRAVGSKIPIGSTPRPELTRQSLSAYEAAYTVTAASRTTITGAVYVNDLDHNINFAAISPLLDPYTATNPPPGWPLPASVLSVLAANGVVLPRTGYSYRNLGPRRDKGIEVSVDHRFNVTTTGFANYSWQARPTILSSSNPYPATELTLPPSNRFNLGVSFDGARFLGSAAINYSDKAFWSDVLTPAYHGYSNAYTMVNGTLGVKWSQGQVTTLVKATNLLNQDIQQHVFGDVLKRSATIEVRFKLD
jgi:outer membrane receptor protein involved in Fe transport